MGTTCELYRLSDAEIEELKKLNPDIVDDVLDKNFACVNGKYHTQKDTIFPMDKGWGVTRFLIQECDTSPNKILNQLNERFIESSKVKLINKVLESIEIEDLINAYDQEKLIENRVYHAKYEVQWEFINDYHLKLYKSAFKKASELNSGIVTSYT